MGAVSKIAAKTPAYKIIARLEKKTEIKPIENTSPFASKESAVIASLFPNYTLAIFFEFMSFAHALESTRKINRPTCLAASL